jgi:choline dehydrogenase-like flavoprotein
MSEASFDPEFIVIGSGPAGVSAAIPLVAAGRRVLMIDGSGAAPLPPADAPSSIAWHDVLGRGLEALQPDDGLSPKLRTPTARNVIGAFQRWSNITTDNFLAVGALARGGLSRVWGGYVSEFDADDLAGWPITYEELQDSYRAITERIGVSGSIADDMGTFHGRSGPIQPAPPIGPTTSVMLERYRRAARIADFSLGLARNALLTLDRSDRRACDLSLSCLWGCARGAIYDARYDLLQLCRSPSFRLVDQTIATAIDADGAAWRLLTQTGDALRAPRILLAAGTLGTLRLVAPLLADRGLSSLRLLNSPVQVMPLLVPSRLGRPAPQRGYTLAQLGYALRYAAGRSDYIIGGLYEVAALPPSTFAARLPLGRRAATQLVRALASALVVATAYFPGSCSDNTVSWRREGNGMQITVRGGFAPDFEQIVTLTCRRLARIFRRLGTWAMPGATIPPPGTDAHFGGLFPMGSDAMHGTSRYGELRIAPGLFIVDGSAHPTMPAKFITLSIMANADRIARHLAQTHE